MKKRKKKNRKCLLLFSGGLDSLIAAQILKREGIKITLLCFESLFFNCQLAKRGAKELNLPLKIKRIARSHLKIVKKPKYGRGKGMNPCLDCHLLMVKKAGEIMKKEKYDFIATGDVLGERPFSQNREALRLIEKESCLEGLILKPLSAKLLPQTIPEKKGWVNRKNLLSFSGKRRKEQIGLAKKLSIQNFPLPAGGCILTDPIYSQKLKRLLGVFPRARAKDIELLKRGRIFWQRETIFVVGRNEKENEKLKKLKKKGDILLESENFPGPSLLIRSFAPKVITKKTIKKGAELIAQFTKKIPSKIIIRVFPSELP